jgi:2-polyprenyl-3-methyl-5-hydroxy-6-metoxy-1,4-benzoquinol methylase
MKMHQYIEAYDELAAEGELFRIPLRKEFILSAIGSGKRVLDVGCLGGQITEVIRSRNNEVFGIEANPRAAGTARERGIDVTIANVEDGIPFQTASFDAVNACEVVEHLYDTKSFFDEVARVLRPGGVFVFTTPNLNSMENRIRVARGGYLGMAGAYPEDHFGSRVRIFNIAKVREICEQTGFAVEEVRGIPGLETRGPIWDRSMKLAGKFLPSWSKILMVKARRRALY